MKAIYAGSFNPFTNGHLDIVVEASKMFDTVYLLICTNASKTHRTRRERELTQDAIWDILERLDINNVEVVVCDELIAEFAKKHYVDYIIRGLRNNIDYNYEENIAAVNELINPELRHIYFRASNAAISSSMVKELIQYGKDISEYVPKEILRLI